MMDLELRNKAVCPHCDMPMALRYIGVADGFWYFCTDGCKAEYGVILNIGATTEVPICGAKRVQTYGH